MKKRTALFFFCLLFSLSFLACAASTGESSAHSTEHSSVRSTQDERPDADHAAAETDDKNASGTYYRMTYTKELDVNEIMNALLTKEAEKEAYETAEMKELSSSFTDVTSHEWSMTVDGVGYQWWDGNGNFSYSIDAPHEPISNDLAEEIARDFLKRLGWESSDELQMETLEDGTIKIMCRLYYNGVKLMGQNSLFFEPDNDNEIPVTGSYISMTLSGDRIRSMIIDAIPQTDVILQTYDAANDFLTMEEVEAAAKQYLEIREQSLPPDMVDVDLTQERLEMEAEIIYMPYRDLANGDLYVLMPVFEIRVPTIPGSFTTAILLYMDAVTGYIYDKDFEF